MTVVNFPGLAKRHSFSMVLPTLPTLNPLLLTVDRNYHLCWSSPVPLGLSSFSAVRSDELSTCQLILASINFATRILCWPWQSLLIIVCPMHAFLVCTSFRLSLASMSIGIALTTSSTTCSDSVKKSKPRRKIPPLNLSFALAIFFDPKYICSPKVSLLSGYFSSVWPELLRFLLLGCTAYLYVI